MITMQWKSLFVSWNSTRLAVRTQATRCCISKSNRQVKIQLYVKKMFLKMNLYLNLSLATSGSLTYFPAKRFWVFIVVVFSHTYHRATLGNMLVHFITVNGTHQYNRSSAVSKGPKKEKLGCYSTSEWNHIWANFFSFRLVIQLSFQLCETHNSLFRRNYGENVG